jgi:predicted nucleic acid-binding protein
MYVDSAYIAKFYVNEPDSPEVRALLGQADVLASSRWAVAEVACAFHRHLREGRISQSQHQALISAFTRDIGPDGVWDLAPVSETILRKMAARLNVLPATVHLRAGDAIHLLTAAELGEMEIWSNDRHLLAAAPHFGLVGRSA